MAANPVPPSPRVLRPHPAGNVHWDESAGHHREIALQYKVGSNCFFLISFFSWKIEVNIHSDAGGHSVDFGLPSEPVNQSCLLIQTQREMKIMACNELEAVETCKPVVG